MIFEVSEGRAASARFFLEPVDNDGSSVNDAVSAQVVREPAVAP